MPNQYLYLSSKNSENHADFNCDLPNGLRIMPYSQLRVLSCRLNVDPNVLSIDSTNNVFYIGVDHWNKNYGIIPLLPVSLTKGDYDVTQPTNVSDLCQMIKTQIDNALRPYCFVRGGVSVSIADRKLTIKVSGMNIYSCPTRDFTGDEAQYWINEPSNSLPFKTDDDLEFEPCDGVLPTDIKWMDDDEYKGVFVYKDEKKLGYHISAPVITGLTGGTENAPFTSHVINVNLSSLTDFEEEPEQVGVGVGLEPIEYIRFCYGDCSFNSVSSDKVIYKGKLKDLTKAGSDDFSDEQVYNIEITNKNITVILNTGNSMEFSVYSAGGSSIYKINSEFQFKYELYDTAYASFQRLTIQIKNAKTNNQWVVIPFDIVNDLQDMPCSIRRQRSKLSNDNLAILINSKIALDADMISYTIACDDPLDQGVGFLAGNPAGSFGVHTSKSANIPRLLTILDDNINAPNDGTFSKTMMDYMADAQSTANMFQVSDLRYLSTQSYEAGLEPSAECLAFDSNTGIGMQTTSASYGTGIVSQANIITTGIEYPLFYVSIPSLPIRNYSASDSHGTENQFVCAVELEQSQSSSFYTSKIYTEQYNVLQNAQDIEIDRIHIRICDIDSVAVEALKQYTTLVLEIKDDPRIEQQLFFNNLKDYMERRETVPQVIDYQ